MFVDRSRNQGDAPEQCQMRAKKNQSKTMVLVPCRRLPHRKLQSRTPNASKGESVECNAASSLPQASPQEAPKQDGAEAALGSPEVRKSGLLSGMLGDQEDSPADPE